MDDYAVTEDPELRNEHGERLRENTTRDRFFYVLAMIFAVGVAVTFQLARSGGFELWMVIPGAGASFAASIVLWWTDAFRYRP